MDEEMEIPEAWEKTSYGDSRKGSEILDCRIA